MTIRLIDTTVRLCSKVERSLNNCHSFFKETENAVKQHGCVYKRILIKYLLNEIFYLNASIYVTNVLKVLHYLPVMFDRHIIIADILKNQLDYYTQPD